MNTMNAQTLPRKPLTKTRGATLIEVLVSILILAFGMLSLGAMLGYAVQAPKLAVNRAIATNLAGNYIERIRANPNGYTNKTYHNANKSQPSYGVSKTDLDASFKTNQCAYPDCTATTLAEMDIATLQLNAREELPNGGVWMQCESDCNSGDLGNLWVIWDEPQTAVALNAKNSDVCPDVQVITKAATAPRCLYVRFKL